MLLFPHVLSSVWQLIESRTTKMQLRTSKVGVLKSLGQGKDTSFLWPTLTGLTAAFMLHSISEKLVTKVSPQSKGGESDHIIHGRNVKDLVDIFKICHNLFSGLKLFTFPTFKTHIPFPRSLQVVTITAADSGLRSRILLTKSGPDVNEAPWE